MGYGNSKLYMTAIYDGDLKVASKKIETILRKKLRLNSGAETDLTTADFSYFLPQIRPIWEDVWKVERHTDVTFYNLYQAECFDRIYKYCGDFEYAIPSIGIFFAQGILWIRSRTLRPGHLAVCLTYSSSIRNDDTESVLQARQHIKGIAKAFGIENRLTEIGPSFVFEKEEYDGKRIISHELSFCPVNPASLTLQLTNMPFHEIDPLFRNAVAFLRQQLGKPNFIRLQRQVLYDQAADTAKALSAIDDRWDMSFFSEYRKKFDPFIRPSKIKYERMYPVVRRVSEPTENDNFLDLQVTVYHGTDESYLLLHTQRDQTFLQEIADEAGLEISEFGVKEYHGLADLKI